MRDGNGIDDPHAQSGFLDTGGPDEIEPPSHGASLVKGQEKPRRVPAHADDGADLDETRPPREQAREPRDEWMIDIAVKRARGLKQGEIQIPGGGDQRVAEALGDLNVVVDEENPVE